MIGHGYMELLIPNQDAVSSIQVLHDALNKEAASPRLERSISTMLYKSGIRYGVQREELARELAHTTLTKAWEKREKYDPQRGNVNGWLHGIAINQVRECLRQRHRLPRQLSIQPEEWEQLLKKSEDQCQKLLDREFLDSLKQLLSDDEKQLIDLRHTEGLDCQAVAERLSIKHGTVRTQLSRLHSKLQMLAKAQWQEGSS